MMKKINKVLLYLSISILPALSCTKQISLVPTSSISSSSFWKTENDATSGLFGMYARFRLVTAANLFLWGEARSQDMNQSKGNDAANLRTFANTLDATAAGPDWTTLYQVVNDANLILQNVPNIKFVSINNKNRILAEAYAMRAFCYFVMVKTWGPVPIVTESVQGYDPSKIYKERSTVPQVFAFVKGNIDSALSLFSDNNFTTGRNRWSKPAANALKGDVYLWTGKILAGGSPDFTVALNALSAIDSSNVSLLPDFGTVFNYNNKGNNEIIMASNFTEYELMNPGGTVADLNNQTFMVNMYIDAFPPKASPAQIAAIAPVNAGGGNYWTLSDQTRNNFSNDDSRKSASFYELVSADPITGLFTVFNYCVQRKFDGLVDAGNRLFLDDVVLYRYGDILLLKAEAKNALAMDPSLEINKVRQRAYGTNYPTHVFISTSADQNDSLILNERSLELLYEGKRWWDIVRFGKASVLIPFFKNNPGNQYKYLWPLSLNILSLEPKVTQNPGY
jgi:hypothetical protein